jgi:hypothetical protein
MDLKTMSDDKLFDECVSAIWRAAAGESRGGDDPSYNHAMELMDESLRRQVEAGHTSRCRAGIYNRAFEKATANHSGRPVEEIECGCGVQS